MESAVRESDVAQSSPVGEVRVVIYVGRMLGTHRGRVACACIKSALPPCDLCVVCHKTLYRGNKTQQWLLRSLCFKFFMHFETWPYSNSEQHTLYQVEATSSEVTGQTTFSIFLISLILWSNFSVNNILDFNLFAAGKSVVKEPRVKRVHLKESWRC